MPAITLPQRRRSTLSFRLRNLCLLALGALASTGLRGQNESAVNLRLLLPDGGAIEAAKARVSIRGPNFSSGFSRRINEAGLKISLADRDDVVLRIEVVANRGGGRLLGTHTIQLDAQGRWRKALDGVRLKAPVIGLEGTVRTPDDKPVAGVRIEVRPGRPYRATTGPKGRFRIWMPARPPAREQLELKLRATDFYLANNAKSLPVRFGDRHAAVTIKPAARMRFDATHLPEKVHLWHGCRLVCEHAATGEALHTPPRLDYHGDHFLLPPGRWNLVFLRGRKEVLRLDDVLAEGGIENHDPRLMEFCWQRLGTLVRIDVLDRRGRPTLAYRIVWRQAGSVRSQSARSFTSEILVPPDGLVLGIKPNNGAELDLGVVKSDRTIELGKRQSR